MRDLRERPPEMGRPGPRPRIACAGRKLILSFRERTVREHAVAFDAARAVVQRG